MQSDPRTVRVYLGQAEFLIPAYQRPYQWTGDLLEGLWSDLGEMYVGSNTKRHYIGVVLSVVEPAPRTAVRGTPPSKHGRTVWTLVDGQQRMVTLLLLLAALRDAGSSAVQSEVENLISVENGSLPRLIGQEEDRELLTRILTTRAPKLTAAEKRKRVGYAYDFFARQMQVGESTFWNPVSSKPKQASSSAATPLSASKLLKVVLDQLEVTDMMLTEEDQSAPAVFDAINGKRRELEPVDLLRNTMFAELDDIQLFARTWAKIESEARPISLGSARLGPLPLFIDSYLRSIGHGASQYMLARRLNELIRSEAPLSLKAQERRGRIEALVHEIVLSFTDFKVAQSSAFGSFEDQHKPATVRSLDHISMLSSGPPLPLSLLFLRFRRNGFITQTRLYELTRILESYLARRVIVGQSQQLLRSQLGTVVDRLIREFGNHSTVGKIEGPAKAAQLTQRLRDLLGTGPLELDSDDDFVQRASTRSDYGKLTSRQRFAILRRLNDHLADRHISDVRLSAPVRGEINYSIEHVFPESFSDRELVKDAWRLQLEEDGQSSGDIDRLVELRNSLGNYTLVHQNSALGTRPFRDTDATQGKRRFLNDRPLGLSDSVVKTIGEKPVPRSAWTAAAVEERARYLATKLNEAYPRP